MGFMIFVSAVIELLTQLPAAFPGLLMWRPITGIAKYPLSANRAEGG
jgi:hypothetical protein